MEEAVIIFKERTQAAFQPGGAGALPSSPEAIPWAGCSLAGYARSRLAGSGATAMPLSDGHWTHKSLQHSLRLGLLMKPSLSLKQAYPIPTGRGMLVAQALQRGDGARPVDHLQSCTLLYPAQQTKHEQELSLLSPHECFPCCLLSHLAPPPPGLPTPQHSSLWGCQCAKHWE